MRLFDIWLELRQISSETVTLHDQACARLIAAFFHKKYAE
jgi:hypothetical protein